MTHGSDAIHQEIYSYQTEVKNGAGVKGALGTATRGGLTKREYFAGLAMQGLEANSDKDVVSMKPEECARWAVQYADALIAELNKPVAAQGEGDR